MKNAIIVAWVLATFAASAKAEEFTDKQRSVLDLVGHVIVAGTDRKCPRISTINEAIWEELLSAGLSPDEQMDTMEEALSASKAYANLRYNESPSQFCNEAWRLAGPGTSKNRQMLR